MTPEKHPDDIGPRDEFRIVVPAPARRAGPGARAILFAGVAGACVLGVGLGLWARPAMNERQASAARAAEAAKTPPLAAVEHKLAIIVEDRAAPIGAPIEVLPASTAALAPAKPAAPTVAPAPSPQRLIRVQAEKPVELPTPPAPEMHASRSLTALIVAALGPHRHAEPIPLATPEPAPWSKAKPHMAARPLKAGAPASLQIAYAEPAKPATSSAAQAAHAAALKAAAAQKAQLAQAARKAAAAQKVQLAQAALAKAAAHKAELAQAAAHKAELAQAARKAQLAEAHRVDLAKAEQRAERQQALAEAKAAKLERVRLAKAARAQALQLAQAEARGRAEARAEAKAQALAMAREDERKRQRLAALVHAFQRLAPHHARSGAASAVELAEQGRHRGAKGRHEARVEQASLKGHRAARAAAPAERIRPVPLAPEHPSGLMKTSAPRCANRDPGAALVCADPSLGAADRQLTRAYQGARAAGVSDAQLQRQQQRWLAARSAAAREAPWAVHDVYLARIAELNGQAKEAHGDGY